MSLLDKADFKILSGKFGLLRADDKIATYDYLLKPEDVSGLVEKLKEQITPQEIEHLTFFAENRDRQPNWKPYYAAITRACEVSNVPIKFVEVGN